MLKIDDRSASLGTSVPNSIDSLFTKLISDARLQMRLEAERKRREKRRVDRSVSTVERSEPNLPKRENTTPSADPQPPSPPKRLLNIAAEVEASLGKDPLAGRVGFGFARGPQKVGWPTNNDRPVVGQIPESTDAVGNHTNLVTSKEVAPAHINEAIASSGAKSVSPESGKVDEVGAKARGGILQQAAGLAKSGSSAAKSVGKGLDQSGPTSPRPWKGAGR